MTLRWVFGFVLAVFFALLTTPAASANSDTCWQMIMQALDRSARAPHARFTSYGERATIVQDGRTLENVRASITYRDDGLAYVDDDRWGTPFVSRYLEPGPPVLGPYGNARNMWLGFDDQPAAALPVIANVHNHPNLSCRDGGQATLDGQTLRHLYVGEEHPGHLGLRSIWIDPSTFEIRRVVVIGPLRIYDENGIEDEQADYTVDVRQVGGYTVVDRVWWKYSQEVYSQRTVVDAEYDFSDYHFSDVPPPGTLPAGTAAG